MKVTHHCDECGAQLEHDAPGCSEHPDADIVSVATQANPPSARLSEVSRFPSRCCDIAGAVDLRLILTVAGQIGARNYGAGGRSGSLTITLVPDQWSPAEYRPYGDALDHWVADRDGLLRELPERVQAVIVTSLAHWLDDARRAVDVEIAEVAS